MKFNGLWRHNDFLKLWSGQTISVFGSMIGGTAMSFTAILVLQATPNQMGVLNSMELLPAFLAGLFAGAWVDRLHRRPVLIGVDLGRALILSSIPLAALLGLLHIGQIYFVALAVSILSVFFDVAYQSYLPSLVGKNDLAEGNSKLSASAAVAEFGGFSLAGWLVQALTAPIAVLVDAASFIISALSVGMIRSREPVIQPQEHPNLRREISDGLHIVREHPLLRSSAVVILIHSLSNGMYGVLVVLFMVRNLGFSPGILTMTWGVGGISSFIGASYAVRITRRLGAGPVMFLGLFISALAGFIIPFASGATWITLMLLILAQLSDGFATIYEINQVTLRQGIASEAMQGRVNATFKFIDIGARLAGTLTGGWLGGLFGLRPIMILGAIGTLLAAFILGSSPIRQMKRVIETTPD